MGVFADLDGTTVGVALGAVVLALLLRSVSSKSSIPLPPGPRGWPIIGNMLEVPPVVSVVYCN